jgi:hypothetical protein
VSSTTTQYVFDYWAVQAFQHGGLRTSKQRKAVECGLVRPR